jgi:pyruvate dehydrogenase E2 component (dihydrolipoamide acetyltransferase)/2-oxoisovalerate dehydrogenase E2 component (dihydrolipoyl transacylase)
MDYRVPELGEGVYEAEFVDWLVRPGQHVERGQSLAEVMTDKATVELPAPFAGVIDAVAVHAGQTIEVGQVILHYTPLRGQVDAESAVVSAPIVVAERSAGVSTAEQVGIRTRRTAARAGNEGAHHRVQASPAVRRLARAMGVELRDVPTSGPHGRVLIDDLGRFVRAWKDQASARKSNRANAMDLGTPGERIKLQGVRRLIAEHMVLSKKTIPHYSYIDECDVTAMVALRNELKRPFFAEGVKLTSLPFYVKAAVAALQRVPLINASLDEQAGEIVLHDEYHVGVATATAKGLVVPVIRHADRLDLAGVAREIERLIRAAQAGTLSREELRGSTFTISSVGNIGGLVSTPIIHHPEVGIVAIGKIFKRPSYNDAGDIVPARIAYLSFSFDHRVVDGSVGANFGNAMIEHLKDPHALLG